MPLLFENSVFKCVDCFEKICTAVNEWIKVICWIEFVFYHSLADKHVKYSLERKCLTGRFDTEMR